MFYNDYLTLSAGLFLTSVTAVSACIAFAMSIASAKRKDPKMFQIGSSFSREYQENGVELAMRALKWGTFYAVTGCSLVCYGIWKFSGAKSMEEFRFRMGSILPKIPKNEIPQSRTEFAGLTDLLTYLANDYGKAKTDSKEN
uniref:Transmembrane protein 242 n=1 Tax=Rhodnius prolixus TaxID=13249 RepID=R4FJX9_RHOPR